MGSKGKGKSSDGAAGFVRKLFSMVDDPSIEGIEWSEDGDSFFISEPHKLPLSLYFKHNKLSSFIRQLNMYDFSKVPHINEGGLDAGDEVLEFRHPSFKRGREELLKNLERKKTAAEKGSAGPLALPVGLDPHAVFAKLTEIREEQKALSKDFKRLEQENALLWQEAQSSRDLHQKNSESINAIVRFLGSVFGGKVLEPGQASPSTPLSPAGEPVSIPPRRRRLLLKDVPESASRGSSRLAQEVEIPFEDDGDLPVISSETAASELPRLGLNGTETSRARMPSESGSMSGRFEEVPSTEELDPRLANALSVLANNPQFRNSDDFANLLSSYNFDQSASAPTTTALTPRNTAWSMALSGNNPSASIPISTGFNDFTASLPGMLPGPSQQNLDNLEKRRSANMQELGRISDRTDQLQSQIDDLMKGLVPSEQVEELDDDAFWEKYLNTDSADVNAANGAPKIEALPSRSPSVPVESPIPVEVPAVPQRSPRSRASKRRQSTAEDEEDEYIPTRASPRGKRAKN